VVIGGGMTAVDAAVQSKLLGADEVTMVYRRGAAEMSGYAHELVSAKMESVRLVLDAQPVAVLRDAAGAVKALRVARTERGTAVAGSERDIPCDFVALAIGQSKLRAIAEQFPGVKLDARGCVVADALTGATGHPQVFSGGDCVNGGKEVVNAVADGRNAARHLHAQWTKHAHG
jgi:dihydropyrimidine dehydrogenase (NAD+) subunit PreT